MIISEEISRGLKNRRWNRTFIRGSAMIEKPGSPVLLTHESAGEDESDMAWAVRGRVRDLGKYALSPLLPPLINEINQRLRVNDGVGEQLLKDTNEAIVNTRYSLLGRSAIKPILDNLQGHQNPGN